MRLGDLESYWKPSAPPWQSHGGTEMRIWILGLHSLNTPYIFIKVIWTHASSMKIWVHFIIPHLNLQLWKRATSDKISNHVICNHAEKQSTDLDFNRTDRKLQMKHKDCLLDWRDWIKLFRRFRASKLYGFVAWRRVRLWHWWSV